MGKWNRKDLDRFEKRGRFRKPGKKKTHAADLSEELEKPEDQWNGLGFEGGFAARVVEVHKKYAFVSSEPKVGEVNTRDVWLATIARKFLVADRAERNFVAVGDRVFCIPTASGEVQASDEIPSCVIQHVSPRVSKVARLDPHTPTREHVIAANVDNLLIVASFLKPKIKWGLVDRYLVVASLQGVKPIIVLTKPDLLDAEGKDEEIVESEEMVKIYRDQLGYDVLIIQANAADPSEQEDFKKLDKLLEGKVTLLSGHSGVGKSSIVNQFDPEITQVVEPDEDIFYKGRHTTSFSSFIKLKNSGYVIDSPGVRSFAMADPEPTDLANSFVEFQKYLGNCKFRMCRHIDEPECAIREAVKSQEISKWRYKSYLAILLGASGREGRLRDIPPL